MRSAAPAKGAGGQMIGFKAQTLFPGRTSVRIRDVAQALGITHQQVISLIEEYRDTNGESGLAAVDVTTGLVSRLCAQGKAKRCHWRIPVAAFDAFVAARQNNQPVRRRKVASTEEES